VAISFLHTAQTRSPWEFGKWASIWSNI